MVPGSHVHPGRLNRRGSRHRDVQLTKSLRFSVVGTWVGEGTVGCQVAEAGCNLMEGPDVCDRLGSQVYLV